MLSLFFVDHQLVDLEREADQLGYDLEEDPEYIEACQMITDQQMEKENLGQQYDEIMVDAVPAYNLLYKVIRRMRKI